jgi:hypothetical protein
MSAIFKAGGKDRAYRHYIWTLISTKWTNSVIRRLRPWRLAMGTQTGRTGLLDPIRRFYVRGTGRLQHGPDGVDPSVDGVDGKQNRPCLYSALHGLRAVGRQTCPAQRRRHPTGGMTCSLCQSGGQRSGGDDRSNPWQDERDRCEQMSRQFAQTCRRARLFDLGTWRTADVSGEARLFVMVSADDGNLLARDARRVQFAGGGCRRRGIGEKGNDQRMGHRVEY